MQNLIKTHVKAAIAARNGQTLTPEDFPDMVQAALMMAGNWYNILSGGTDFNAHTFEYIDKMDLVEQHAGNMLRFKGEKGKIEVTFQGAGVNIYAEHGEEEWEFFLYKHAKAKCTKCGANTPHEVDPGLCEACSHPD